MNKKKSIKNKTDFFNIKPYYNTISGKKEKWIEFEFYDQIKEGVLSIAFGHFQNKIRLFFGLWSMKIRDDGDCEITMTYDNIDEFSEKLIEMAQNSKTNNLNEDNLRTIRFESSDKETDNFPKGMAGNIVIIACIDMVQIIIHFDDPREEWAYSLVMKPQTIIEFAHQLNAIINDNK